MMFTVAAMLTNVSALAIGRILMYMDLKCGLIGAFFCIWPVLFSYTRNIWLGQS